MSVANSALSALIKERGGLGGAASPLSTARASDAVPSTSRLAAKAIVLFIGMTLFSVGVVMVARTRMRADRCRRRATASPVVAVEVRMLGAAVAMAVMVGESRLLQ